VTTRRPEASSQIRRRNRVRRSMIACVMILCATPLNIHAQASRAYDRTDFQSWDELDLLSRFSRRLYVTWIMRTRFSVELPNPAISTFETDWNFDLSRSLALGPSYDFSLFAQPTVSLDTVNR